MNVLHSGGETEDGGQVRKKKRWERSRDGGVVSYKHSKLNAV